MRNLQELHYRTWHFPIFGAGSGLSVQAMPNAVTVGEQSTKTSWNVPSVGHGILAGTNGANQTDGRWQG
jgi:hypothetical protein